MTKLTNLICKPCQSGKTFLMFNQIVDIFENCEESSEIHINFIFTANSLLQCTQTCSRIGNSSQFSKFETDGKLSLILSSKSKISKWRELSSHFNEGYRNVILCSNRARVNDLSNILQNHPNWSPLRFNIWIDEADQTYKLFSEDIEKWKDDDMVSRITFITATPERILKGVGIMNIVQLENTYTDKYHRFSESQFVINNDVENLISHVFDTYGNLFQKGTVWYIPTKVQKLDHHIVKGLCMDSKHNINCVVINSSGIQYYQWGSQTMTIINDTKTINGKQVNIELSEILADLYEKNNLKDSILVITGNLCISRGITISSDRMVISHAIFNGNITNIDSMYQMAGRICGNFKQNANWINPMVFCNELVKRKICLAEDRAINLAKRAYDDNKTTITKEDYKMANSLYKFHQIGGFLTFDELNNKLMELDVIKKKEKFSNSSYITVDDGFIVPKFLHNINGRGVVKTLKSGNRLSKDEFDNIEVFKKINTKNCSYKIYPVYDTMDENDKCVKWYARYRTIYNSEVNDVKKKI